MSTIEDMWLDFVRSNTHEYRCPCLLKGTCVVPLERYSFGADPITGEALFAYGTLVPKKYATRDELTFMLGHEPSIVAIGSADFITRWRRSSIDAQREAEACLEKIAEINEDDRENEKVHRKRLGLLTQVDVLMSRIEEVRSHPKWDCLSSAEQSSIEQIRRHDFRWSSLESIRTWLKSTQSTVSRLQNRLKEIPESTPAESVSDPLDPLKALADRWGAKFS